ncbi:inverse autotransporter beta domain-containing protein [Candidatus Pelagibacter sp.]|nr:inverse autotransporter beta domain-containing protein [Candidatus Pelagibacter sp.]
MKKLFFSTVLIYIISINSVSVSAELVKDKINEFSNETALAISNFAKNNFENMKYLDFDIQIQEKLKPSFSIMSVTELLKIDSGTVFNQTSLNTHDNDETVNIGFGYRKLLNDNKILIGSNIFYDHQFDLDHKRTGAGLEAISSIFDLRGNYYNALSGSKTTSDGSERALDGWDTQLDYHLPGEKDVNIFANLFEFENPDSASTYEEKGTKFGANASLGNFTIEGGYLDDNQNNDAFFGSIKFVVKLGDNGDKKKQNFLEFTDVSDNLYQPVKRENKIRVVKISKSGVKVGGF